MECTMKHAEKPEDGSKGMRVLKGQHQREVTTDTEQILDKYDATALVGIRTLVCESAIERADAQGEVTIEVPKLKELMAAVAVARCLMPIRLRGAEMRVMRRRMKLTLAELAKRLDERTAAETVSRWESEAQPMGGYAEKLLRLLVCEELRKDAPGIEYNASMIAKLIVHDPWRVDPTYEVPPVVVFLIHVKEDGLIKEAWNSKHAA